MADWQAVVIGGGIINGIGQSGQWPAERLDDLLHDDHGLSSRWRRAKELASVMADSQVIPIGTRYDALRMLGAESWDRRGPQLVRYLEKGHDPELQQGAISALGDMPAAPATQALVSALAKATPRNRKHVIDGLMRDDSRREALLDCVQLGRIGTAELGDEVKKKLLNPSTNRSHELATRLLSK